jgi:hypothetical protein
MEKTNMTGFNSKQAMAADKLKPALVWPENKTFSHWSDCAVHNEPAYPAGACDCGVAQEPVEFDSFLESQDFYELMQTYRHCQIDAHIPFEAVKDALRAVHAEAALAQPAQEPVALTNCRHCGGPDNVLCAGQCKQELAATTPPLPVQRKWVGLTDEDRKAALLTAYKEWECEEFLLCAREDYLLIEQALKEKNG